ncbi:hypothetical protein E8P82_13430 [Arthrobacter echini]|uniref:Uncharacterized protein n=1 Tax=Arthrobacter echini TaxID=1529066 RepID=A0A4S5E134_9MICC|nr:hypothetical protein [Arthrobacter echini]THJ64982.1 hypothetical protein E8P82_13430 [Arthrobacter echini]
MDTQQDEAFPSISLLYLIVRVAIFVAEGPDLLDRPEYQKGSENKSYNGCDRRSGGGLPDGEENQHNREQAKRYALHRPPDRATADCRMSRSFVQVVFP